LENDSQKTNTRFCLDESISDAKEPEAVSMILRPAKDIKL